LNAGEDVLLARGVQRQYALRSKRQILLLTSAPRIVILSSGEKSEQKIVKIIPWAMSLSFGMKDPSKFFIQIGKSKKVFKDIDHNASKVLDALEKVMSRHREIAVSDQ